MTTQIPNTLTIAGMDPSGGAGILADVKTMSALGAYACAVVAALTAQNTHRVSDISIVNPDFIQAQIDTLFDDVRIDAVKIGMLGQSKTIEVVGERLAHWKPVHIVLDPVMVAKSGDLLLEQNAISSLREYLLSQATVVTPNLPEAGVLLGQRQVESVRDMRRVAERLRNMMSHNGHRWVLLKGGHLPGDETIDILHDGDKMIELPGHRIQTRNTHGTGCTLSAALAALLPKIPDVPEAAQQAKTYLVAAIVASAKLEVGTGHGPLHHFHHFW
ncbi:hydroxymethylpyrimidine kinase /phosphomethylpyrimidine kinase [Jezberella montanilacus]|jgi:hydroxymethylpyrimidine/phosphomethylpyrimidine kinase|uniref:hydroxymethylpyrimidine kinase n=1 Tax=Jezberella montanilacus TaxID=323426 RepID=A0A2T0XGP5_9BURK|nr:bifunctional hydroxymethylpyrimidine kinase/phosphomethylpyrimidine kinase [Jezberella montanilacus]PRY98085.1 hydroxymethylpyrimidine kinase /phosphomethylpyrimidine kinase [Jezberella montanilacus]